MTKWQLFEQHFFSLFTSSYWSFIIDYYPAGVSNRHVLSLFIGALVYSVAISNFLPFDIVLKLDRKNKTIVINVNNVKM